MNTDRSPSTESSGGSGSARAASAARVSSRWATSMAPSNTASPWAGSAQTSLSTPTARATSDRPARTWAIASHRAVAPPAQAFSTFTTGTPANP